MQVVKTNITNPTLNQLIDKKEMSTEERLKEAEAKVKQEAEKKWITRSNSCRASRSSDEGLD